MSENRKYKIGDKVLIPLFKNKDGTSGVPVFSLKNNEKSNLCPGTPSSIELEIIGTYDGIFNGIINSPYLFKITNENLHHFKSKTGNLLIGLTFAILTSEMQKNTVFQGSSQDSFYVIEKDFVDQI
jgi:hypothetical protein